LERESDGGAVILQYICTYLRKDILLIRKDLLFEKLKILIY